MQFKIDEFSCGLKLHLLHTIIGYVKDMSKNHGECIQFLHLKRHKKMLEKTISDKHAQMFQLLY